MIQTNRLIISLHHRYFLNHNFLHLFYIQSNFFHRYQFQQIELFDPQFYVLHQKLQLFCLDIPHIFPSDTSSFENKMHNSILNEMRLNFGTFVNSINSHLVLFFLLQPLQVLVYTCILFAPFLDFLQL